MHLCSGLLGQHLEVKPSKRCSHFTQPANAANTTPKLLASLEAQPSNLKMSPSWPQLPLLRQPSFHGLLLQARLHERLYHEARSACSRTWPRQAIFQYLPNVQIVRTGYNTGKRKMAQTTSGKNRSKRTPGDSFKEIPFGHQVLMFPHGLHSIHVRSILTQCQGGFFLQQVL